MAGSLAQAAYQAQALGPAGWVGLAAAMIASYVLSDLGTGIYHWSVDNYGDGQTPIVGKQIAAFQVGPACRHWLVQMPLINFAWSE